jgi:ABC-2 type transport system permease protein
VRTTLRALRHEHWTIVAFAIAGFAITLVQSVAYFRLAGPTFADRAAFAYRLVLDATTNAVLLPPPVHPETVAGYLELRAFEPLAILFAAWALVSATRSSTVPTVPRAAAFAISTLIVAAAACIGVLVGVASGGESVDGVRLVEAGLLLVALAMACYAICLWAGRIAAPLLLTLFFLNSLSRVFTQLDVARWLSPFRYYDLSTPLPHAGPFDVGGLAVLLAIALLGIAAAAILSTRPVARPPTLRRITYEPSRARFLAIPVARVLYPQRIALAAWCVAFAVVGLVLVAAARTTMHDLLELPPGLPGLRQYLFVFSAYVLGQTWLQVALLMSVALVFAFTARWAAEGRDGQLEAVLSAPYSRSAVVVERLAALAFTAAALAALSGLVVALMSHALDVPVYSTHLAGACLLLLLFSVVLGAAGLLLASWAPRAAPALLIGLVLAFYLDDQVGSALGVPGWVQDISPFRLMGVPIATGIDGHNLALLLALAFAGLGSSILAIQRLDVGGLTYQK